MKKRFYLLDTGPTFDCMFRRRGVHERLREVRARGAKVGICTPVLGEIIAGVENSQSRDAAWDVVRRNLSLFVLWPYEKKAAHTFGRIFAELKRIGRPMQQIDIQIAAIALTMGNTTVVTSDSDLAAVPGRRHEENPSSRPARSKGTRDTKPALASRVNRPLRKNAGARRPPADAAP